MMNIFETLSKDTQQALDDLRIHLINESEVDLVTLETHEKGLAAFVGYCVGFLRAKGCSLSEACDAVTFARTKKFWAKEINQSRIDEIKNYSTQENECVITLDRASVGTSEVYDAEFEVCAEHGNRDHYC